MELRDYQENAVTSTFSYINKGGRGGILALITAAGKSVVLGEIFKRILMKKPHVRMMMVTHTKELIEQNYLRLKTLWPQAPVGLFSAGIGKKQLGYPITYGGIQSMYKRAKAFGKINLLMIDECHLISDKDESMYVSFINELRKINPDMVVIGLTATPYRLGMGYLTNGPIFQDIYFDNTKLDSFVDMIDKKYVSNLIPIDMEAKYDLSQVKVVGGDFQEKSLDDNINRDEITKKVVAESLRHIENRKKGLVFCVSMSHAENMAMRYNELGIKSTFIHSNLTKDEREKRLKAFANGEYKIITNVGVLTTGFDQPDIDFLIICRPSQSTALHVQMLGRGMRIAEGKVDCLVLDFSGNTLRLGPVNDPVIPMPKGQKGGEAPVKVCEHCKTICHAAVHKCPVCEEKFPPPKIKFDQEVKIADIIKRRDLPVIDNCKVQTLLFNRYITPEGLAKVKMTVVYGVSKFVDVYLTFDPSLKSKYTETMNLIGKLRFSTDTPELINATDALEFLSAYHLKPTNARIWMNKPIIGKNKKYKSVLSFDYNEEE